MNISGSKTSLAGDGFEGSFSQILGVLPPYSVGGFVIVGVTVSQQISVLWEPVIASQFCIFR